MKITWRYRVTSRVWSRSGLSSSECSSSTREGLVHFIKKDWVSTRFFAAFFMVVAAVQSDNVPPYILVSIFHRLPYAKWRFVTVSRNLWSMEQERSKSQWVQECNKWIIILSKRIGFRMEKMVPSSGWLPPCSSVVKKWAKATKIVGEKVVLGAVG